MVRILYNLIPSVCRTFLDDICIKGPDTTYGDALIRHGLRRYVVEHIQNIDKVLVNCELAGVTIAVRKSQWCRRSAVVVGYVCGIDGRRSEEAKIIKIKTWKELGNIVELRRFLGFVGFYRVWIAGFAEKARPLTRLLKKEAVWRFDQEEKEAFQAIKDALDSSSVLTTLRYDPETGEIILQVDASLTGWGAVLLQVVDGQRRPARFESGV